MPATKNKLVNIITLGCSKNTVDSEKLMKQLDNAGFSLVYDENNKSADITIINTCGFISDAKKESIDTILQFADAKNRGDIKSLYVMGCLSERYKDDLRKEIPEVDKYFGVNDIKSILKNISVSYNRELYSDRFITGPGHYAYLKISEGCDRTCAFCAIPMIRGKYFSRPEDELIREAQTLAGKGIKELILVAQDLSYYGLDIYKKQMLPSLVRKLSDIDGFEWIRLHYLYPANFPIDILQLMKDNPRVCNYIDLPIQHISDNVLSLMRRTHSGTETRSLLDTIRSNIPGAAIRTTLIAGHPGETEKDFKELLDFVSEFRFDRLGVFPYSHEEDTYGYRNYDDDIPEEIKTERVELLMETQRLISLEKNESLKGREFKTIIDRREGVYWIGRSEFDSPEVDQEILIPASAGDLNVGQFTRVRITGCSEFDLIGEVI